jgi:hypothetical protein
MIRGVRAANPTLCIGESVFSRQLRAGPRCSLLSSGMAYGRQVN